jgi:glycosyltransferase involved in cell wall biosynthesis
MAQILRVLLLIPHLGGGGAEKVTALLAQGLSKEKYEIHLGLITQEEAGAEILPSSVTIHRLGAKRVRAGAFALLRLVRRLQPDLILSGMAHLNFLVLLLRSFFPRNTRVLVRQNGTVSSALAFGNSPRSSRWLYQLLYRRADRIICQSRAMADDLADELRICRERIAVLPNPLDFEAILAANRASSSRISQWSGDGPHLLAIGRLAAEKGFDLLLHAFVPVRQRFPGAELIIVGAGPEELPLKALCHSLGLAAAVHFPGHTHQPYDFYAGASLFVLPSRHEGMPNALLEAAVAGLPIVALPASGGIVDLLSTLEGAWLASKISAAALTAALLDALCQLGQEQRFDRHFSEGEQERRGAKFGRQFMPGGEFAFESAIAAYEQLLDSTCAQPKPHHVALLIPTLDRIGGAERQVILLAEGLHSRGWRVSVVALSGSGGATATQLAGSGIAFLSLSMRKGLADPRGWVRFAGWLRRERPHVVHAHLYHAAWLARCTHLCAPGSVVIDTLHSSSTGTMGRRLGYRLSRSLPDQVTAVSRSVAGTHLAAGVVKRKTLTVVNNGVNVHEWKPNGQVRSAVRQELGFADEFLWLAAGRLETVKDYPTLLKAMAASPLSARLLIAGDGPLFHSLAELSSQLGLSQRVRFLGFAQDIKPWFQAADAFVLSSLWEGLPMALLEAAACSLPAVATDVAGTREAILDGITGSLVPAGDPLALAGAMNAILQIPSEERRAMGVRARKHVMKRFSLDATLDRYEELYSDLFREKLSGVTRRPVTTPDPQYASASRSEDVF